LTAELAVRVSNVPEQGYQGILIFAQDPGSALSGFPYISHETVIAMEMDWRKHLLLTALFF
jgi:hypothetical protein